MRDNADRLREQLLNLYLQHPSGRKVIKGWFEDAGRGAMGPGDLLQDRFPGYFAAFVKQSAKIATLCYALDEAKWRGGPDARKVLIAQIGPTSTSDPYRLAPKNELLASLGYYLLTPEGRENYASKKFQSTLKGKLAKFYRVTGALPDSMMIQGIRLRAHDGVVRPQPMVTALADAEPFARTVFGHPVLLDKYPAVAKLPIVARLKANKITRRNQLYNIAREIGLPPVAAMQEIGQFLDGQIISRAAKSLNQLRSFPRKLAEHQKMQVEKAYKGIFPVPDFAPVPDSSQRLETTPIFKMPAMLPVLRGLQSIRIETQQALTRAVIKLGEVNQQYVYSEMPLYLAGRTIGNGPRLRGKPTKLAVLVAQLAKADPDIVYAGMPIPVNKPRQRPGNALLEITDVSVLDDQEPIQTMQTKIGHRPYKQNAELIAS